MPGSLRKRFFVGGRDNKVLTGNEFQTLGRLPVSLGCLPKLPQYLNFRANCQQGRARTVVNKPVLPEVAIIRGANSPVGVEAKKCFSASSLQTQTVILEFVHLVFVYFDVPVKRWFVAPFEEVDICKFVFGL